MAMSLNRAQIIGNLTRDPEVRQTPQGITVVSFGVATNFVWADASGARQERAEFHNIVAWRKLGEICAQYLKKGSKVYVDGRIQTRDWTGEDGIKRYRTEIVADNVIMLDRKGDMAGTSPMGAAVVSKFTTNVSPQSREHGGLKETPDVSAPMPEEEEVKLDDLPF